MKNSNVKNKRRLNVEDILTEHEYKQLIPGSCAVKPVSDKQWMNFLKIAAAAKLQWMVYESVAKGILKAELVDDGTKWRGYNKDGKLVVDYTH